MSELVEAVSEAVATGMILNAKAGDIASDAIRLVLGHMLDVCDAARRLELRRAGHAAIVDRFIREYAALVRPDE